MPIKYTLKDYKAQELLQNGRDHIHASLLLLDSEDPYLYDSAGYLAHLGIELILKSWILHIQNWFFGEHSLNKLAETLQQIDPSLELTIYQQQIMTYLSRFELLRYPESNKPVEIGSEDIEQILELANSIWLQIPDSLFELYENIPSSRKAGRLLMERASSIPRDLMMETGIKESRT